MNRIEARVDQLDPRVSVRLRWLKKRWKRDIGLRLVDALVRQGDVTVDIGANRGVYTLALASAVGRDGRVHSFEPLAVNLRSLRGLSRSRSNIVLHPMALSDTAGSADMHVPIVGGSPVDGLARLGGRPSVAHDTVRVEVGTLDEELGDCDPPPSYVKCDVEGHEPDVLRGGRQLLTRHLPALVVEIEQRHRGDDITSTIEELLGWGYEGYALTSRSIAPIEAFDVERDQLRLLGDGLQPKVMPPGYVGNFLFVRPGTDLGRLAP